MRHGELSATQAHEVTSASVLDPSAEADLLGIWPGGVVGGVRRAAKKVRAAATDNEKKARDAHENRDFAAGSDEETGEGWYHGHGTTTAVAERWPISSRGSRPSSTGPAERADANAEAPWSSMPSSTPCASRPRPGVDTSPAPARGRPPGPTGHARRTGPGDLAAGPPVNILVRVDLTTILRGHAIAGETCEIDGLGPCPWPPSARWFPQAAIDLIITKGVNVFNVTHFGRNVNARQEIILDWLGEQCPRLGCGATRNLQIDHRVEWSKIHITEIANLDKLCIPDHNRKTRQAGPSSRHRPPHGPPPITPTTPPRRQRSTRRRRPAAATPPDPDHPRPPPPQPERHGPAATRARATRTLTTE